MGNNRSKSLLVMKILSLWLVLAYILLSLVGPVFLAACSLRGGHGMLSEAVADSCSSDWFIHLAKHTNLWQELFLFTVGSTGLILILLFAASQKFIVASIAAAIRFFIPPQQTASLHMKIYDPFQEVLSSGIINMKLGDYAIN